MKICILALSVILEMVNNGYSQIIVQRQYTDVLIGIIEQTVEIDSYLLTSSL